MTSLKTHFKNLQRGIKRGVLFDFLKFRILGGLQTISETDTHFIFKNKSSGALFQIPESNPKDQIYCTDPLTELNLKPFFKMPNSDGTGFFLDIGSFIGRYSLDLALQNPQTKVLAIEPDPISFSHLTANISLNNLQNQITPLNLALGREEGTLPFIQHESQSRLKISNDPSDLPTIQVPVTTFPSLLQSQNLNPAKIHLIKIDVEGHELPILQQITQLKNQFPSDLRIICEVDYAPEPRSNLITFMQNSNWQVTQLDHTNFLFTLS